MILIRVFKGFKDFKDFMGSTGLRKLSSIDIKAELKYWRSSNVLQQDPGGI